MNRAPKFLMLECPGAARRLAFGLRWLAVIGSDVQGLARARGRRLRATHYIVCGSPATMAGYGRALSPRGRGPQHGLSRRRGSIPIQAAAQLYAVLYPAGGHCLVPLPDGRYWLAAAHDGTVLSQADRVFDSQGEALRAQSRLLEQRPDLVEHDAGAVWAALLQAVEPRAELTLLPSRWRELPLVLRLFLICVGLSAAAPLVWNRMSAQLASSEPPPSPRQADTPDTQASRVAMLEGVAAHARAELSTLLHGVGKLPIQVQGWALRHANCMAGDTGWECSAAYARAHSQATNQALHSKLPAGWRVSFKPLDEATLRWRTVSALIPLAALSLPSALRVDTEWVGALQQLQPAFAAVALEPAVAFLPASAGLDAAHATPSAHPAVRRRALRLHGPLRSLTLLPGPLATVRWSRLALRVQPQHRPTLAASTLVAELHGDLYEQD